MNYLIKKLKDQATTRKFDGTGTDMGKLVLDEQKFAELIVMECIDNCLDARERDRIKEHFGVSE